MVNGCLRGEGETWSNLPLSGGTSSRVSVWRIRFFLSVKEPCLPRQNVCTAAKFLGSHLWVSISPLEADRPTLNNIVNQCLEMVTFSCHIWKSCRSCIFFVLIKIVSFSHRHFKCDFSTSLRQKTWLIRDRVTIPSKVPYFLSGVWFFDYIVNLVTE